MSGESKLRNCGCYASIVGASKTGESLAGIPVICVKNVEKKKSDLVRNLILNLLFVF